MQAGMCLFSKPILPTTNDRKPQKPPRARKTSEYPYQPLVTFFSMVRRCHNHNPSSMKGVFENEKYRLK